jgi:hypothetical protein
MWATTKAMEDAVLQQQAVNMARHACLFSLQGCRWP